MGQNGNARGLTPFCRRCEPRDPGEVIDECARLLLPHDVNRPADFFGVIEERAIRTGIETASSYEVLAGVIATDDIVIGNRSLLKPGQRVEAKPKAGAD